MNHYHHLPQSIKIKIRALNHTIVYQYRKSSVFVNELWVNILNQDRAEDMIGHVEEENVCTWSEKDWIEDISEEIAKEVL